MFQFPLCFPDAGEEAMKAHLQDLERIKHSPLLFTPPSSGRCLSSSSSSNGSSLGSYPPHPHLHQLHQLNLQQQQQQQSPSRPATGMVQQQSCCDLCVAMSPPITPLSSKAQQSTCYNYGSNNNNDLADGVGGIDAATCPPLLLQALISSISAPIAFGPSFETSGSVDETVAEGSFNNTRLSFDSQSTAATHSASTLTPSAFQNRAMNTATTYNYQQASNKSAENGGRILTVPLLMRSHRAQLNLADYLRPSDNSLLTAREHRRPSTNQPTVSNFQRHSFGGSLSSLNGLINSFDCVSSASTLKSSDSASTLLYQYTSSPAQSHDHPEGIDPFPESSKGNMVMIERRISPGKVARPLEAPIRTDSPSVLRRSPRLLLNYFDEYATSTAGPVDDLSSCSNMPNLNPKLSVSFVGRPLTIRDDNENTAPQSTLYSNTGRPLPLLKCEDEAPLRCFPTPPQSSASSSSSSEAESAHMFPGRSSNQRRPANSATPEKAAIEGMESPRLTSQQRRQNFASHKKRHRHHRRTLSKTETSVLSKGTSDKKAPNSSPIQLTSSYQDSPLKLRFSSRAKYPENDEEEDKLQRPPPRIERTKERAGGVKKLPMKAGREEKEEEVKKVPPMRILLSSLKPSIKCREESEEDESAMLSVELRPRTTKEIAKKALAIISPTKTKPTKPPVQSTETQKKRRHSHSHPTTLSPKKKLRCGGSSSSKGTKIISNWRPVDSGEVQIIKLNNESLPIERICYKAIRHWSEKDEVIRVRDCVRIRASEGVENIGKITHLHYDESSKALMATILWFYTPMQVDTYRGQTKPEMHDKELLASRHLDTVNVDCIECLAFVLTVNEFYRFAAETKIDQLPIGRRPTESSELWPRGEEIYPRRRLLPHEDTPMELVYFCRGIYSPHSKRIRLSLPNSASSSNISGGTNKKQPPAVVAVGSSSTSRKLVSIGNNSNNPNANGNRKGKFILN